MSSKNNNRAPLPPILNEIADVVGYDAVIAISATFGGGFIHIPKCGARIGKLEKLIGRPLAKKLSDHFGPGLRLSIPHGPFGQQAGFCHQVYALDCLGLSSLKIARLLKISRRTVCRWRAVFRAEEACRQRQLTRSRTTAITKRK